jgi:hypothetical protein
MSTIGSLAVNVVAKTDPFNRGVRGVRKEVGLLGSAVGGLHKIMLGFGATMATGFSVRALANVAREMDSINKQAGKLGMTTEALTGLSRAADLAGADARTLGTAMSFMERNIEKGSAAFGRLRLEAEFLARLKPELQFMKIADAIKQIPNPGGRLQAARDIFGKQGEDLMPLMLGGSEKIRREMAMQPGFNSADGSRVEGMNDAWTRVKHSLTQTGMTLVTKFEPALLHAAERLNSMAGGASFEGVSKLQKEIDKLSDSRFAAFRTAWNSTGSTAESDAGSKFLGMSGLHMQKANVNAAIREREMRMLERHQEMVARASPIDKEAGMFDYMHVEEAFDKGLKKLGDELPKVIDELKRFGKALDPRNAFKNMGMSGGALMGGPVGMMGMGLGISTSLALEKMGGRFHASQADRGFTAMEMGTAEAFTQERRSRLQNTGANSETQILKEQLKVLQKLLETNMRTEKKIDPPLQAANLT